MANQYQLLVYEGYLGKDPEMRYTPNGTAVTNFNLGSTRTYKVGDEQVDEITWLRVTTWGKLAEFVYTYCHKGSHVLIEGILHPGKNGSPITFQLKNGDWASSFEVTARKVRLMDSKQSNGYQSGSSAVSVDDDIPWNDESESELPY